MDGPAESSRQTHIDPQRDAAATQQAQPHSLSNEALFQSEHNRARPPSQRGLVASRRYPISDLSESNQLTQSENPNDIYFSGKLASKEPSNNVDSEGAGEPAALQLAARHLLNIQGDVIEEEAPQTQRSDAEAGMPSQSRVHTQPVSNKSGSDVVFFDETGPVNVDGVEQSMTQEAYVIREQASLEELESAVLANSSIE